MILVEDESRMIGRCAVPETVFHKMQSCPKKRLEASLEERVENIFKDYILDSSLGTNGDLRIFSNFRASVQAISRRLGPQRAQEILDDINASQRSFENQLGLDSNREWIQKLLVWYYDPRYAFSLNGS